MTADLSDGRPAISMSRAVLRDVLRTAFLAVPFAAASALLEGTAGPMGRFALIACMAPILLFIWVLAEEPSRGGVFDALEARHPEMEDNWLLRVFFALPVLVGYLAVFAGFWVATTAVVAAMGGAA